MLPFFLKKHVSNFKKSVDNTRKACYYIYIRKEAKIWVIKKEAKKI